MSDIPTLFVRGHDGKVTREVAEGCGWVMEGRCAPVDIGTGKLLVGKGADLTYDGIRDYITPPKIAPYGGRGPIGILWRHPDGRQAQIRREDFPAVRPD